MLLLAGVYYARPSSPHRKLNLFVKGMPQDCEAVSIWRSSQSKVPGQRLSGYEAAQKIEGVVFGNLLRPCDAFVTADSFDLAGGFLEDNGGTSSSTSLGIDCNGTEPREATVPRWPI